MKLVNNCVCCGSDALSKKQGAYAPFIAFRALGLVELPSDSVMCQNCDFVFSQVRFDSDEMARIYANYRGEEYTQMRDKFEPGYAEKNSSIGNHPAQKINRRNAMFNFLLGSMNFNDVESVVDYGGDAGQYIPDFFNSAAKKYVFDVSKVEAVDGVESIDSLDGLGKIDFVMNCNVLEHMPYPMEFFDKVKQICTEDTYLFIDVPFERMSNAWPTGFHEHINFFNEKSLSALIQASGFNLLKMQVFNINYGWTNENAIYALAKLSK